MIPKSISSITTVEDLQVYACSKVRNAKDWLMKCADCKNCPVGKKAEELLDKETAPVVAAEKETALAIVERAMKQQDPAKWLLGEGYYRSIKAAREAIRRYERGLFSKSGYTRNRKGLASNCEKKRERVRLKITSIFGSANTLDEAVVRYISSQPPAGKITSAMSKLYEWKQNHPDLVQKYPLLSDVAKYLSASRLKKMTAGEFLKEFTAEKKQEPAEDEVSIDEFLDEVEEPLPKPATDDFGVDLGDKLNAAAKEAHITPVPATPGQKMLLEMFSAKRKALAKEQKECLDRIEAEKKRLDYISKSIKDLDNVASLFGMAPKNKPEA